MVRSAVSAMAIAIAIAASALRFVDFRASEQLQPAIRNVACTVYCINKSNCARRGIAVVLGG